MNVGVKKQVLFTLLALILFAGFLETACFLLLKIFPGAVEEGFSEKIGSGSNRRFLPGLEENTLAPTVLFHVKNNVLTYPDGELMFHVKQHVDMKALTGYEKINSLGYRGDEFDLSDKKPGEQRILIVGDSCGFGSGLFDYAETFQSGLEKLLSDEPVPYTVFNLSQPGYTSTQGLLLFEQWVERIKPDYVVLYFGWNDIWKTSVLSDRETISILRWTNIPAVRVLRNSHSYRLFHPILKRIAVGVSYKKRLGSTLNGEGKTRVSLEEAVRNYEVFLKLSDGYHARLLIISPPHVKGFPYAGQISEYNRAIGNRLAGKAYFLELRPLWQSERDRYFLSDGIHPNESGAKVIAAELVSVICKKSDGS